MRERSSIIRMFDVDDEYYYHKINLDDDSITCYNEQHEMLFRYDNNAKCYNKDGVLLAEPRIEGGFDNGHWAFEFDSVLNLPMVNGYACKLPEGLLDTEVLVSKKLLGL
jgi:hypothetical protein